MLRRWAKPSKSRLHVNDALKAITTHLNYTFSSQELLQRAFTHRSSSADHNERLEFLGDAVLDLVISDILFTRYPNDDEGDLSRMRSWLVKKESLYLIGEQFNLSKYIVMGEGESRSGGMQRKSTVADTVEALIAAVYLDGGFEQASIFIHHMFEKRLEALPEKNTLKDAKSRLQELLQHHGADLPEYTLVDERGKPHEKVFTVACFVPYWDLAAQADAASRRKAEQVAAQKILDIHEKNHT